MRILGIDYGDSRTGFSISDELSIIATPLQTYESQTMRKDIDYASQLANSLNVSLIVLGLPLKLDGNEGTRACKTRAYGRVLEKVSGLKVVYQDERLTSVEADEILRQGKLNFNQRKKLVDSMAARIILQSYLNQNKKIGE